MLQVVRANGERFNMFRSQEELNTTSQEFVRDLNKVLSGKSRAEQLDFLTELYSLAVYSEFPKKNYQEIQNSIFKLNSDISIYFALAPTKKDGDLVSVHPQLFAEQISYSLFIGAVKRAVTWARNDDHVAEKSPDFKSMLIVKDIGFYEFIIGQFMECTKTEVAALVIALLKMEIVKKAHIKVVKRFWNSILEIPIPKTIVGSYQNFNSNINLYFDDVELRDDDELRTRVEGFVKKIETKLKDLKS